MIVCKCMAVITESHTNVSLNDTHLRKTLQADIEGPPTRVNDVQHKQLWQQTSRMRTRAFPIAVEYICRRRLSAHTRLES